jgi:hypothetical protein
VVNYNSTHSFEYSLNPSTQSSSFEGELYVPPLPREVSFSLQEKKHTLPLREVSIEYTNDWKYTKPRTGNLYEKLNLKKIRESLRKVPGKIKKHGKFIIGTIIYESILAKYLYDLYSVMRNSIVNNFVDHGMLPIYPVEASLFPWPSLEYVRGGRPLIDAAFRPMRPEEHAVKFFYDHPILQIIAILAPFIVYGVYHGIKKYKNRKNKR